MKLKLQSLVFLLIVIAISGCSDSSSGSSGSSVNSGAPGSGIDSDGDGIDDNLDDDDDDDGILDVNDDFPLIAAVSYDVPATEELFSFSYFNTQNNRMVTLTGVVAFPQTTVIKQGPNGGLPWVVVGHGSGGMWSISGSQMRVASPLDMSLGNVDGEGFSNAEMQAPMTAQDIANCDFTVNPAASYGRTLNEDIRMNTENKNYADYFLAKGVGVVFVDSYNGRCRNGFRSQVPPHDIHIHPVVVRVEDTYNAIEYMLDTYDFLEEELIGYLGTSQGGGTAYGMAADPDLINVAPQVRYSSTDYNYPSMPVFDRSLAFSVVVYGGSCLYGYFGDCSALPQDLAANSVEYANRSPVETIGCRNDGIYTGSDNLGTALASIKTKADFHSPSVAMQQTIIESSCDHSYMGDSSPSLDDAAAQDQTWLLLDQTLSSHFGL